MMGTDIINSTTAQILHKEEERLTLYEGFSTIQLYFLNWIAVPSAILSFTCSLLICIHVVRRFKSLSQQQYQNQQTEPPRTYHRLMFGLSFFDMVTSLTFMVGSIFLFTGSSHQEEAEANDFDWLCSTTGFFLLWGLSSSSLYNASLSIYFVLIVCFQIQTKRLIRHVEPIFHLICTVPILIVAVMAGLVHRVFYPSQYQLGCWIVTLPEGCEDNDDDASLCINPISIGYRLAADVANYTVLFFLIITNLYLYWTVRSTEARNGRFMSQSLPSLAVEQGQQYSCSSRCQFCCWPMKREQQQQPAREEADLSTGERNQELNHQLLPRNLSSASLDELHCDNDDDKDKDEEAPPSPLSKFLEGQRQQEQQYEEEKREEEGPFSLPQERQPPPPSYDEEQDSIHRLKTGDYHNQNKSKKKKDCQGRIRSFATRKTATTTLSSSSLSISSLLWMSGSSGVFSINNSSANIEAGESSHAGTIGKRFCLLFARPHRRRRRASYFRLNSDDDNNDIINNNGSLLFGSMTGTSRGRNNPSPFFSSTSSMSRHRYRYRRLTQSRRVAIQSFFLCGGYFMTYVFAAVVGFLNNPNASWWAFTLTLLERLFLPSQGTFNALVYFLPRYKSWQRLNTEKSRRWHIYMTVFTIQTPRHYQQPEQ